MNSFIKKLVLEGSVKLTESSDTVCESYLLKSEKSLISSKTLLMIENYDDATALTYYAMYYSALALLFKVGIKSENHTGTIILLKEVLQTDNTQLKKAKKERIDKQYYVDFKATQQDVQEGIRIAEEFNSKIKQKIDTISQEQIKNKREQFKKTYF